MRTTLTLDDDLAAVLKEQARRADQSFNQVVNDTLRRGLSPALAEVEPGYVVRPHRSGFRPGLERAVERLLDPADSVLDWDEVRDGLLDSD